MVGEAPTLRYDDPVLGLFTQSDWWDPPDPGVGTARHTYSHSDPVNYSDPGTRIATPRRIMAGLC